jgi:ecotin
MGILQLTGVFLLSAMAQTAQGPDILKPFAPAAEGMARFVIILPPQADESLLRVQLIVGKTVQIDEANRYFFAGKIDEESVKGWGYTQYRVAKLGPMAGTLMGVDPKAPKVARFVSLGGEPYLIRYNSKLPVVLYVPADAEVQYRIWRAAPQPLTAKQG